eukprot:5331751-Pleurochrysis_carterae.AAC.1
MRPSCTFKSAVGAGLPQRRREHVKAGRAGEGDPDRRACACSAGALSAHANRLQRGENRSALAREEWAVCSGELCASEELLPSCNVLSAKARGSSRQRRLAAGGVQHGNCRQCNRSKRSLRSAKLTRGHATR